MLMTFSDDEKEEYRNLIGEIVDRSQDVFLWVFLVVRSLGEGMANGDSIINLQRRLRSLPVDLEKFFQHILQQVEDLYQQDMARTFQQALQATEPLTLIKHSFLEEADDSAINISLCKMDMYRIDARNQRTRRRIAAHRKGLMEVCSDLTKVDRWAHKVEFLHRAVRGFLLTKDMQQMLNRKVDTSINISRSICRSYLALIKTVSPNEQSDSGLLVCLNSSIMHHAYQAEVETGIADGPLLRELEAVLDELSSRIGCSILNQDGVAVSPWDLVLSSKLDLYIRERKNQFDRNEDRDEILKPHNIQVSLPKGLKGGSYSRSRSMPR